jgi:hypothetical protein
MKVTCKYNDPGNVPAGVPDKFDFGLEINKDYLVMGIAIFQQSNEVYFLVDEGGRPSWYPHQIFATVSNDLPDSWFLKINEGDVHADYQNLFGFYELCNEADFFNRLLAREETAMRLYFRRKIEAEQKE